MTTVESQRRRTEAVNEARTFATHPETDRAEVEALIAASEPAVWARFEILQPVSYRSTYVRRAHRAGFEAGLEFARLAFTTNHADGGSDE